MAQEVDDQRENAAEVVEMIDDDEDGVQQEESSPGSQANYKREKIVRLQDDIERYLQQSSEDD